VVTAIIICFIGLGISFRSMGNEEGIERIAGIENG
jgi:hypothetical protein